MKNKQTILESFKKIQEEAIQENFNRIAFINVIDAMVKNDGFIVNYFEKHGVSKEELQKAVNEELENYNERNEENFSELKFYLENIPNLNVDKPSIPIEYVLNSKTSGDAGETENAEEDMKKLLIFSQDLVQVYFLTCDLVNYGYNKSRKANMDIFEMITLTMFQPAVLKKIGQKFNIIFDDTENWYNNIIGDPKELNGILENYGEDASVNDIVTIENEVIRFKDVLNYVKSMQPVSKIIVDITEQQKDKTRNPIKGKQKILKEIYEIFLKSLKKNVVLHGKAGVGKTATVQAMAYDIIHNSKCPFKGYKVLKADDLIYSYELANVHGEITSLGNRILNKLIKEKKYIFVIDEFKFGLFGNKVDSDAMFICKMVSIVKSNPNANLMILCEEEEYKTLFEYTNILPREFEGVVLERPRFDKVKKIILDTVKVLEKKHNVKISNSMIDYVITVSSCHFFTKSEEPERSLEAIEKCLIAAEQAGKTRVTYKDIYNSFKLHPEKLKKADKKVLKSIAYHEASHFVVGQLSRYAEMCNPISVSIMPAEFYLGVTVFEETNKIFNGGNREWFIDAVALDLAGRVGEKMYTGNDTEGASSDLASAARKVYNVIISYGMGNKYGKDQTVPIALMSDEMKTDIYHETEQLTKEAKKRAEEILTQNKKALEEIVELLLKDKIVSYKKLNKIIEKYKKS